MSENNGHAKPDALSDRQRMALNEMSELLSRHQIFSRAGQQFGGRRDLYDTLGYSRVLQFRDYLDEYRRQGIAKRIVDAPANGTWRRHPTVRENDNPNSETRFERQWRELTEKVNAFQAMQKADRITGIGRYGIILIGAPGRMDRTMQGLNGPQDIRYLQPFMENHVEVAEFDDRLSSPRFGMPQTYRIDPDGATNDVDRGSHKTIKVHWSRVIHIAEDTLDDEIWGTPRLRPVFNRLYDLEKVVGGSGEAYWRIADRGIQFDVDKDMELGDDEQKQFADEIEEFLHGMRRYMRTRGVTANVLGSDTPDPSGVFNAILSIISGTTGIPQRILTGSESGELASTMDMTNWVSRIQERQEQFAEPVILRPLIERLIQSGALKRPKRLFIDWPELMATSENEKANTADRFARALRAFEQARQAMGETVITSAEFRKMIGLGPIKPEEVNDLPDPPEESQPANGPGSQGGESDA